MYKVEKKDGKWVLVEQIERPKDVSFPVKADWNNYHHKLAHSKTLPTLDADAPYWEARQGMIVGEDDVEYTYDHDHFEGKPITTYAIPPQALDNDLWDEVRLRYKEQTPPLNRSMDGLLDYLRTHYNLTKVTDK